MFIQVKKVVIKKSDSLLPYNNYAWSKLGGECAVQMYKTFTHIKNLYDRKTFYS